MGLIACEKLNPAKRMFVVASQASSDQDSLMKEYRDVSEVLYCLSGQHKIHVIQAVTLVVHACRKVPERK